MLILIVNVLFCLKLKYGPVCLKGNMSKVCLDNNIQTDQVDSSSA